MASFTKTCYFAVFRDGNEGKLGISIGEGTRPRFDYGDSLVFVVTDTNWGSWDEIMIRLGRKAEKEATRRGLLEFGLNSIPEIPPTN